MKNKTPFRYGALARFWEQISHFSCIWILLLFLVASSLIALWGDWKYAIWGYRIALLLVIALFFLRPLNAVYGLMGASGSVSVFFVNCVLFCLLFSGIYYLGFFKTAGISYDVNQPHVSYDAFAGSNIIQIENLFLKPSLTLEKVDTIAYQEKSIVYANDGLTIKDTLIRMSYRTEKRVYQSIDYPTVLRNTAMTFLMQEPTDLFAAAATYNSDLSGQGRTVDKQKTEQFHWILIFQVLVGWIFFGVFISLLYNKFRYES